MEECARERKRVEVAVTVASREHAAQEMEGLVMLDLR
jgi:hypothetical protein